MRKIFLVDDEEELLDVYSSILNGTYTIKTFLDPNDVIKAVEAGDVPDVFITDLNMPIMSGVELLEWMRKRKIQKPGILISGFSDKPNVSKVLKLGAVQVLEKPFSIDLFKNMVRGAAMYSVYQEFQAEILTKFRSSIETLAQLEKKFDAAQFSSTMRVIQKDLGEFAALENEIEALMGSSQLD